MNTITATELRTKTAMLVKALLRGESFYLIYRSKIIGMIVPHKTKHQISTSTKTKKF
jgi:antitoxin (DNA-binding transcriptional repressor) of toxin-antitoxin stability system